MLVWRYLHLDMPIINHIYGKQTSFKSHVEEFTELRSYKQKKKDAAWENITSTVNAMESEDRPMSDIKKKCFDLKLNSKK